MNKGWSRPKGSNRRRGMDREAAEQLGLSALLFVTSDPARLSRFLGITGMDAGDLKASAGEPATLAALLGHIAEDDSTLLVFTATAGCAPEDVANAQAQLGFSSDYDRST